ncbi:MAG: putative toxin-antitoxin system toxin component, PIN family [Nitrospirae bacterium]|nr:putative toxin-antitoxin system toxin component, PIN family [Nitrospirota bacterium]
MRIVFDTNIFISAIVIPHSQAEKAILKIIEGDDTLIISREIINEVLTVLATKFHHDREAISHVALYLLELGQMTNPKKRVQVFKDEPDNRILECALSGKVEAIVTGDKEMLKLKEYEGIKIISLKEYLEL